MEIKGQVHKIKCDMPGCKELGIYSILNEGNKVGLNFCKSCLIEMHKQISKFIAPKSPTNILNNKKGN